MTLDYDARTVRDPSPLATAVDRRRVFFQSSKVVRDGVRRAPRQLVAGHDKPLRLLAGHRAALDDRADPRRVIRAVVELQVPPAHARAGGVQRVDPKFRLIGGGGDDELVHRRDPTAQLDDVRSKLELHAVDVVVADRALHRRAVAAPANREEDVLAVEPLDVLPQHGVAGIVERNHHRAEHARRQIARRAAGQIRIAVDRHFRPVGHDVAPSCND